MSRILINNVEYPCPLDFNMSQEANIVNELTTMSGRKIADINGWRYSDITLKWNWVENSKLQTLLAATADGTFEFTFKDVNSGEEITINALRKEVSCTETASLDQNGNLVWKGIEMKLSFPDCFQ